MISEKCTLLLEELLEHISYGFYFPINRDLLCIWLQVFCVIYPVKKHRSRSIRVDLCFKENFSSQNADRVNLKITFAEIGDNNASSLTISI